MRCQSQEALILGCLLRQLILSAYIISIQHRIAGRRKASLLIQNVCLSLSRLKSPLQSWDLQRFCIPLFLRRSTPTLPGFWGPAEKDFTAPESSQFFLPRSLNDFYLATEVKAEPQTHKGLAGQAFPIKSQALVRDTERHEILLSHNCVIIPAVSGGAAPPPSPENLCFAGLLFCEKGSRPCLRNIALFSLRARELGGDAAATTITNRSPSSGDADTFRQFAR